MPPSETSRGMPELMKRFLEAAYDRRNSNEWGGMSMHGVCNDIGLNDSDDCEEIMNMHRRFGNITDVQGGPQMDEPGWFKLTPQGIEKVQQWRGR